MHAPPTIDSGASGGASLGEPSSAVPRLNPHAVNATADNANHLTIRRYQVFVPGFASIASITTEPIAIPRAIGPLYSATNTEPASTMSSRSRRDALRVSHMRAHVNVIE